LAHRVDAHFTDAAARDKVTGQVQLRVVVDAEGVPQRIVVARPLGYGLDEQAAEAVGRWRFEPATRAGGPVTSSIVVSIDFQTAPAR
jgi:protein TonB